MGRYENLVLLSSHQTSFDLGSGGAAGSQAVRCICPVIDLFRLNIHLAEVRLCLGHAS
jgi:hypothetical protein